MFDNIFNWLDNNSKKKIGYILNQAMPITICLVMFLCFMALTYVFIGFLINPFSKEAVILKLHFQDIAAGFLLYFFTAVDYALIVGRMQTFNSGAKARFVMNVFTCIGCFVGVSMVLFLWGFAKEISWLIIPILIFAGSVMIKLAYDNKDYFEKNDKIPLWIRKYTLIILNSLYIPTKPLTSWVPEFGSPKSEKKSIPELIKWSFLLPFIIGTDDLVGYMGAMTIYNAFGLLFGIYLADIIIDLLIFVSPKFTTKLVENPIVSLLGAYAFLYLAYRSYKESFVLLNKHYHNIGVGIVIVLLILALLIILNKLRKKYLLINRQL